MDNAELISNPCPWEPTSSRGRLHAAAVAARVQSGEPRGLAELYAIGDVTRLARSHRLPLSGDGGYGS
ncbi:hypothetical protein C8N24_0312 [Solirubrobacter pauli]|uniref:Uncharacterized protein n=1 Tax=Solirubrobacter pauli TaxID=166793 RepID=A0A660L685_9ACTN|nr:hypothetical protein [Solirubrobacter pauli]RKQ90507.1 hypothetical protein C8N24_0312 [Solirubrobacter pauli]